ncbi:MAG: glutathione S-transferase family protein [Piscirickettsiaceae bacterium]|nr:glutathione S-transferase family protein [Piscirickettsiaceae bacterium]
MAIGDNLANAKVLYGVTGCANTSKCLFAAAEKGIDINGIGIDPNQDSDLAQIKDGSPFGSLPMLKDSDFYVYGTEAILSYLDDKGFGNSLIPRNAVARTQLYQWAHVAQKVFAPEVKKISDGNSDATALEAVKTILSKLENQLKTKVQRGDYIVGDFSLADIHWAPYIHACCLYGNEALIDALPAVKTWWSHMKVRKSTSKENYVAYTVLPSLDEISNNKMRSVSINA